MLTRVENGVSYTQGWNQENRLQTVTVNGATTTFTYDGDGKLVKKTVGITTTYYVGPHYEKIVSTNVVTATKYYTFGSQRVAMRVCTGTNGSCGTNGVTSTLTYLHGDHLGSASLSTNATGGKVSEMRYYPYGEMRSGAMATDRQYTGQRREIGLGLYDYNARYYDPYLNRFISPDSIVPSPANPQSLNRYAYVLNNPLRYTDPTGHLTEEQIRQWVTYDFDSLDPLIQQMLLALHFGDWLYNSEEFVGKAGLGKNGLQFSNGDNNYLIEDVIAMREAGLGLALGRKGPDGKMYLVVSPNSSKTSLPSIAELGQCTEHEHHVDGLTQFLASTLPNAIRNGAVGAGIGLATTKSPHGAIIGFVAGMAYDSLEGVAFADPLMGHAAGDIILQYRYSNTIWMQEIIIRGTEVDVSWRYDPVKFNSGALEAPYF